MKDGLLRKVLKWAALGVFWVDLWCTRRLRQMRGEKPYKLGGNCALCAQCCESPMVQVSKMVNRSGFLRHAWLWWMRAVNGFELRNWDVNRRVATFRCSHFDTQTRRCDSYDSRPGMCRDYPRLLLWEGEPPFLSGCGYRAIHPEAEKLRKRLLDEPEMKNLPPEKREALEKQLKLK
ncbi:MAG: YkgJ family cysteine cluster protein [Candidatus Sumerlaeia bacterium]|nr:YkgJ family cysteine cluster protein [Candidatus Sumerlaeia bacterium]